MGLSGTVILCDHVYPTAGGKFVIAGTYTTLDVRVHDLARIEYQIPSLSLYLRVRPERLGMLVLELRIRDESQPPWQSPLLGVRLEVPVTERNIRLVELPVQAPPFHLAVHGSDEARASGVIGLRYGVELLSDGELIASTPFDLRFTMVPRGPSGGERADLPPPPSGDGRS